MMNKLFNILEDFIIIVLVTLSYLAVTNRDKLKNIFNKPESAKHTILLNKYSQNTDSQKTYENIFVESLLN